MITYVRSDNYIHGRVTVILIFLLFCAPLLKFFNEYIDVVASQIFVYGLSAVIMIYYCMRLKYIRMPKDSFWIYLSLYLLFLFLRLLEDYILPGKGNFLYSTPQTILFFYIFPILIPAVFFCLNRFKLQIIQVVWLIAVFLTVCLLLSYFGIRRGLIDVTSDGRYDGGSGVFSIQYGHYGVSLILVSLYLMIEYRNRINNLIILIFCLFLGIVSLMFSGSRGPFVALIICLAFWYMSKHSVKSLLILVAVVILVGSLIKEVLFFLNDFLIEEGIESFNRILESLFQDGGLQSRTNGRDNLYEIGFKLFLDNPLLGSSLFIPGHIYVHNIVLEQFMALGIIGGAMFVFFNWITFVRAYRLIKINPKFGIICLLFVQFFVFGCFSSTIIALPIYWLTLFLINNHWDSISKKGKYVEETIKALA